MDGKIHKKILRIIIRLIGLYGLIWMFTEPNWLKEQWPITTFLLALTFTMLLIVFNLDLLSNFGGWLWK